MKKKIYFIPQIIAFFFLATLIIAFPYLLFTIYPALGMNLMQALRNSVITLILCIVTLSLLSLVLSRFLKPVNLIINYNDSEKITEEEKQKILKAESTVKRFMIIVAILGFLIIGFLSVFSNALRVGYLKWATIRFFFVTILTGPSTAFLLDVYVSYIMQKIKRMVNIFEFTPGKKTTSIRLQIIAICLSFFIAGNIITVLVAISREEKIAGFSSTALKLREDAKDTEDGYFTALLQLCYQSTDPAVQAKALEMKAQWEKTAGADTVYILFIGAVAFLFFGFSIFLFASNISAHLKGIAGNLKSFGKLEGDLSSLVVKTSNTEIGEIQVLFNRLILNINKTFSGILEAINTVISGSRNEMGNIAFLIKANEEIKFTAADVSRELSSQTAISGKTGSAVKDTVHLIKQNLEKTVTQSAMIEEATAAITQLNASIKSVSAITQNAAGLGVQLKSTLQTSLDAAGRMKDAIGGIMQSGKSITEIISTISSIAGQSNLLAINASIEAAHAGAYGRGFAVVAVEIRKLAEHTDSYAREIVKILDNMHKNIDNSAACSSDLSLSMKTMREDIDAALRLIDEINNTSQEQLANSNQNMQATEELLGATHCIMENLKTQNRNNELLLSVIADMERSTQNIENVGKKQEHYFRELSMHFTSFSAFFNTINQQLILLDKKMHTVKLIDKETLRHLNTE